MKNRITKILLFTWMLGIGAVTASHARDVALQWSPVADSSVAGYKIHYNADTSATPFKGAGSALGASPIDAKNVTSASVTGLDPSRTYYFAVTAYNAAGVESSYSNIANVLEAVAPAVSITAPAANATASGTVSVTAAATDNVGVTKLEFYLNGALVATDTLTPYVYSWNTSSVAAGTYTWMAKAYDAAGNMGQSGNVSVTVVKDTTAPTVSLTAPGNNATVIGTTTITASASDNIGVSKVEFYANGVLLTATNVAPYSYNWNTMSTANGSYVITAKAYDAAGNSGQSGSVAVTVNNSAGSTPPPVTPPSTTASTIWPADIVPAEVDSGPDSAVELGVKFRSDVNGYITGVRFYKAATNTGTHIGNLWTSAGARLATATFTNETASGWQQVNFAAPVAITANTVYVASYHTSAGHYSDDQNYFNGKGVDNAPLHALSGSNGVFAYGSASAFPNQSWNYTNYWVDPLFVTALSADTTAPAVSIISPANSSTLSGTTTVTVSATDDVKVSKVEYYVNGTLKATSAATPYAFIRDTTAVANGNYTLTAKAYDAAGNVGQSSAVSVTVNNPAADTTAPAVSVVSPVNNATVSGTASISVNATDNAGVAKVEFYVNGALQAADTASPYTFSWSTVSLANAAYTLTAKAYDAAGNVGQSGNVTVNVNNAVAPPPSVAANTIWPASIIPAVMDSGPENAVELGVKFRSDVSGYITGIRFYKAGTNTGVHIGNLWTNSGRRLATATFSNETASGWQQVDFATPVAITANTVYVASYHTNTGHYSYDKNYFKGKGMDSPPLHALASGVSGANGVYAYGAGSIYPKNSWNATNYWVDVVFKK